MFPRSQPAASGAGRLGRFRGGRPGSAFGNLLACLVLAISWPIHGMTPSAGVQAALRLVPESPRLWNSFLDCANVLEGWAGRGIPEWVVPTRVLSYTARRPLYDALGQPLLDDQGEPRCDRVHLSGRVFFPPAWRARRAGPLPVVLYTHGTALRKDAVPSTFGGHEWVVGAATAAYYGMVVAMPDLPGLGGDSCSYHPYCHRRSLAYALVDALPELGRMLREDPGLQGDAYRWDPRLFLMGCSRQPLLPLLGRPGEGVGHVAAVLPGLVLALGQIDAWRAHPAEEPGGR